MADEFPGPLTLDEIRRRDALINESRGHYSGTPGVNMSTPTTTGAELPPPAGPPTAAEAFLQKSAPDIYNDPTKRAAWMKEFGGSVKGGKPAPGRRAPTTTREFPQPKDPGDEEAWTRAGAIAPTGEMRGSQADAAKRDVWTDVDRQKNAEAKKKEADLIAKGLDPAKARELAGVRVEPGEIGPPKPAEEATDESPAPGLRTGGGGLTMVSPGGRTPHSWTTQTQEGLKLNDDTKRLAEGAETSRITAADQHLQADEAAANAELSILRRHELVQQARETELRERADRQRAQYEGQLAKLNDMTTATQEDRIDPEQWFKTRTAGQKFAAGLGIALGAVSSAFAGKHGVNPGLEMVRDGIREEIDAQKHNAALRRSKLEDQRSMLGQMARTFGDERTAEDAAWILYLERAKTQLAAAAAGAKTNFARARYGDAIASIKEEIAGRREKWDQLEKDKVTRVQHDVNAPPVYAGGGGAPLNATDEKSNQELTERLVKSGIPGMRNDVNRLLSVIPKEGEVPGVTSTGAGTASTLGGTTEKVYGAAYNVLGSTQGQEIRQAAAVLFNRQLKDESGAAVSDQELERQKAAFYGARDARSARAAITNYANRLNELESTVRSGFKPNVNDAQEQRKQTESNRLQRTKKFTGPKAE